MKFLIDMNMSPGWEEVLKAVGVEAVHWSRIGPPDADDLQIMEHAFRDGYVVFTNDLDFGHLLAATNAAHPSVVQVRVGNLRPSVIGPQVTDAVSQMEMELGLGALVTIDPKRTRVRLLPLHRE